MNILYILASAETAHGTYFISPCSSDHWHLRAARQVRAETCGPTLHSNPKKPISEYWDLLKRENCTRLEGQMMG